MGKRERGEGERRGGEREGKREGEEFGRGGRKDLGGEENMLFMKWF